MQIFYLFFDFIGDYFLCFHTHFGASDARPSTQTWDGIRTNVIVQMYYLKFILSDITGALSLNIMIQ